MPGTGNKSFIERLLSGSAPNGGLEAERARSIPLWVSNDVADMYFEVKRSKESAFTSVLRGGGEWRWRLFAAGGELQASSAAYETELQCLAAVDALRVGAARASIRRDCEPTFRHKL